VVCQPGIGWMELNGLLEEKGIFIDHLSVHLRLTVPPPQVYRSSVPSALRSLQVFELQLTITQLDPGPGATIGGMLSTGCSGSVYHISSISDLYSWSLHSECSQVWYESR
jgi:FAD/FMN-containing dehydrogenase